MASISIKFTIHDIISDLSCPFDVWFLDDGTIGGSLDQALNDLRSIQQSFSEIGLSLNSDKCDITVLGNPCLSTHRRTIVKARQILPGLIGVPGRSLILLGPPLGDSSMQASAQSALKLS